MTLFSRPPLLREGKTSLRAGASPANSVPIRGIGSIDRYAIYAAPVGPYVKAGDRLDITGFLHCTDNAYRPDPDPVEWYADLRWSPDTGDNNSGTRIFSGDLQPPNISNESHHMSLPINTTFFVPSTVFTTYYVKLVVWFQHPDGDGSLDMDCPDNIEGLQVLWWRQ